MKVFKVLLGLLAIVAIAAVVVIVIALNNINEITVDTVQEQGSKLLKTQVTLQAANIEPSKGRGELNNLQINNPEGFTSEYALKMGAVVLHIDPASLIEDVIVIKEVSVDGAKIIAEEKNLTDTNLQQLLKNIQGDGTAETDPASKGNAGPDVRLMIEKFSFSNSSVRVITSQFGERQMNLPALTLANIGDKKKGLTPQELGEAVVAPILKQVKAAVSKELIKLAKDKAKEKAKEKLEDALKDKLGGDTVDKLKSLFGK